MHTFEMFIDGRWTAAEDGAVIDSVDPFSGEVWATVPKASPADAARAIEAAHRAFVDGPWSRFTASQRGAVLRKFADLIADNVDALAAIEQTDNGKLAREVRGQVASVAKWFHFYAGMADKIGGSVVPHDDPSVFAYTRLEPLGMVVAITPWNSPLNLAAWKLAPALAAGNTVVIKPSEHTSVSTIELARLAERAGLPPGVLNVVTGYGADVGDALVRHPLTAKVAFTGGEQGGIAISTSAAAGLKKVTLELGGKSPNIVFADADIEQALRGATAGIFSAAGQTCVAGSRLLVHEDIHDAFVAELVRRTKRIRVGDPRDTGTEVGPIATRPQWLRILELIEAAKAEGAHCAAGGVALSGEGFGQGQFVAPTVFTGVTNSMRIAHEEVFGPVLSVIRFKDRDEAISIANDSAYGLAAGVWTQSLDTAISVANALKAGTVWVNNYRMTSPTMPFGGYKRSGLGREGGWEGMLEYLQTKSVWITTQPNRADLFGVGANG